MAAKKRPTRRPNASRESRTAQEQTTGDGQSEETPAASAETAPGGRNPEGPAPTTVRAAGRRPVGAVEAPPIRFAEVIERLLPEQFAPAAVLINRRYEILYYFGRCAQYLELPSGQPTHDLGRMAREGVRTKLRSAVHKAIRENASVALADVRVKRDGGSYPVRVTVMPVQVPRAAEGLLLVTFEELDIPAGASSGSSLIRQAAEGDEPAVRQLQYQLEATREELQGTIEEMETSNQELKAANEGILSMNQELESTNEELETSMEELEALNEELGTANHQLREKFQELGMAYGDIANLLGSTDVATVVLDGALRIKLFTPSASKLFDLIASDTGRPVDDISSRFSDPNLIGDALQVLRQLTPRAKEVSTSDGLWWIRFIMPYVTRDNRIDGVVVTFVDITERKKAADAVVRRLAAIVESSSDAIYSKDFDGIIRTWNLGARRLYGYSAEEVMGQSDKILIPEDRAEESVTIMNRLRRGDHTERIETERVRKDGQRVPVALTVSPVLGGDGKVESAAVIGRDISDRQQAEHALRRTEERFRNMADTAPFMVWMSGRDKACTWCNKPWLDFVGRGLEREVGNGWTENIHPDDRDHCLQTYSAAFDARQPLAMEYRLRRKDGEYRWLLDNGVPLYEERGEFAGYIGSCIDITERRQGEQALRESEQRLRLMMENAHVGIAIGDGQGRILQANRTMLEMVGWSEEDLRAGRLNCGALYRPEDSEQDRRAMRQLATAGRVRPAETTLIRADGATIPVLISAFRLEVGRDENVTFVVDLTSQKLAEQALRQSEAQSRHLLEYHQAVMANMGEGLYTIDEQGFVTYVNPAAENLFGWTSAQLLGRRMHDVSHYLYPDGRPFPIEECAAFQVIKNGKALRDHDDVFIRKDGTFFPVVYSSSPVVADGRVNGLVVVFRDVTERKKLEREVVEIASAQQQHIGQDLHDTVAQELTALTLLARDLAETLPPDSGNGSRLIERIEQGLQRSQQQLRAVLRGLMPVAIGGEGLMAALADLADRTQQEGKVGCTFDCPEPVTVTDNLTATHVYLIAQEAVHNAIKHAKARRVRIGLTADHGLTLSVQDDGVGMAARLEENQGLGLRVMGNRAAIIGATLTINMAEPTGTVVTCTLARKSHEPEKDGEPRPSPDRR